MIEGLFVIFGAFTGFLRRNPIVFWILVGAGAVAVAFLYGRNVGAATERVKQIEAAIEADEIRRNAEHATASLDDVALCVAVGGLRDDCAAVLGSDATASRE